MKRHIPGILWVNSDVIKPQSLSRKDFDDWYCDEHIPDVVGKSGVQSACRYEHINDGQGSRRRLGFLTIYQMPDLNFMETEEFRGLEGQSPGPNRERIFKNAEFDTRAYERVGIVGGEGKKSSSLANLLLCVAMSLPTENQLSEEFRNEHVKAISRCSTYQRTTWYTLSSRSVLSAFERSFPAGPEWLAVHEFDALDPPWKDLAATNAVEWVEKVTPGARDVDFGCFRLMRGFEKEK